MSEGSRVSYCPMCSDVVTCRRKGANIVYTKHVSTESGFPCEANGYEFDASSIRAVAKDGRGKTRGSKSVARRAGNKKPTTRSTPILSSDRAEPSK
jgi:hypothetical protein